MTQNYHLNPKLPNCKYFFFAIKKMELTNRWIDTSIFTPDRRHMLISKNKKTKATSTKYSVTHLCSQNKALLYLCLKKTKGT